MPEGGTSSCIFAQQQSCSEVRPDRFWKNIVRPQLHCIYRHGYIAKGAVQHNARTGIGSSNLWNQIIANTVIISEFDESVRYLCRAQEIECRAKISRYQYIKTSNS